MSSTNRSDRKRVPADFYPTPGYAVDRFFDAHGASLPGGVWVEAGAGRGDIVRAVNRHRDDVTWAAVELRPECRPALLEAGVAPERLLFGDLLAAETQTWIAAQQPTVIFGNIPYNIANRLLPILRQQRCHLVQLLSMGILGSTQRDEFLRRDHPDVHVLPERVKFLDGPGTDSVYSAWMHWPPERRAEGRVSMLRRTAASGRVPAPVVAPQARVLDLFAAAGGGR